MKTIRFCLLLICLSYLVSCGQVDIGNGLNLDSSNSNLAEAATPKIIKKLNEDLEQFTPQVKIISPQAEQILNATDINVQLEVGDLPIFQDDKLQLGNHLDLILDNEPSQQIYNLDEPVILENLSPGTHSIRLFASRPWGESFKNDGAYAQTTFSILTETSDNRPDSNLPLLTYSNPTGTYGAEPILLDFYLTNAPLHAVAQNDPNLPDWRIRTTVNGTSFILEDWQPVYLTGLNQGTNWIQLELIDEAGNNIENTFNNTVRVINYDPQKTDTLAELVTDKISLTEARPIVEQNYYIQPVVTPEIIEPREEKAAPESVVEETTEVVEPVEEFNLEDQVEDATENEALKENRSQVISFTGARSEIATPLAETNLESTPESDIPEITTEIPEQPVTIPALETKKIEEVAENKEDIPGEEKNEVIPAETTATIEFSPSKQEITITEEDSDSSEPIEPIEAIETNQSNSNAIAEDKISITIPNSKTENPVWWKKILGSLRQKIEGLVKLLSR